MTAMEKDDWNELLRILKRTEDSIAALNPKDCEEELCRSRQSLQEFRQASGMLGRPDLERAGTELENYLGSQIEPAGSVDAISAFGFAVSTLIDQVQDASKNGSAAPINIDEILEILGISSDEPVDTLSGDELPAESPMDSAERSEEAEIGRESVQGISEASDGTGRFAKLEEILKELGGDLSFMPNGKPDGRFLLTFSGPSEGLEKIEELLCAGNSQPCPAVVVPEKYEKLLKKGQDFMTAFSNGDIEGAQEILMSLADGQTQAGLYKEIGGLARGLHDSIRSFLSTMDPSLKEMVEDRIPDTGNRLEHMLELTEKAANTTLDHVESMQDRIGKEQQQLSSLRELISGLKAIGDQAESKLVRGKEVLSSLEATMNQNREDLDAILTAQDYQDLSGQIIQKIMKMLKDLELKLVNVIRTFGVKQESAKKEDEELYGPAHQSRVESVHSQDEVDSLLAEFGF
jgi:chemotaxis protein CheZ